MEIKGKFYKLKSVKNYSFYCECVTTSLSVLTNNIIETVAKFYGYKLDDEERPYFSSHYEKVIKELKNMSDEEILIKAFNYNIIGTTIVLPTIPKILLENITDLRDTLNENDYIDITETVVDKIMESINIEEIKEFISTHTDEEVVDKYCANDKYKEMFWDI
jgi:hypothetical protein